MSRPVLCECVPNFSEGRNSALIEALRQAAGSVPGVALLDWTSDADHNRCVLTLAGPPEPLLAAVLRAVACAVEQIDLRQHQGVHPRLGAADVIPFVPVQGITMQECVTLAHRAGHAIWQQLGVPVYFYEKAAQRPERRKLEDVRRGGFEGLASLLPSAVDRQPDLGAGLLHATAGACIVGARPFLAAFNVNLQGSDLAAAKAIARAVRASSGGLPHVKALGLPLASQGQVQVSMNITDLEATPLHIVFDEVARLAALHGVEIANSEVIGLLPRQTLEQAAAHYLRISAFQPRMVLETRLEEHTR